MCDYVTPHPTISLSSGQAELARVVKQYQNNPEAFASGKKSLPKRIRKQKKNDGRYGTVFRRSIGRTRKKGAKRPARPAAAARPAAVGFGPPPGRNLSRALGRVPTE